MASVLASDPSRDVPRPTLWWAASWRSIVLLTLVLLALRLLYLALFCPYTLAEDESHYWEWSRRLGLSYYSKGPGIAWTIALGTWMFGQVELGVRAMGPVFLAVLSLTAAALAAEAQRAPDRTDLGRADGLRAGFAAAVCVNLVPLFQFSGVLITIDGPYVALWAVAALLGMRGLRRGSGPALAACGLVIGVAFLYKYTALLLIPGLALFALAARRSITLPARAPAWLALGALLLIAAVSPVLIWNQQNDWPTFKHLLGHLGVRGGDQAPAPGKAWTPLWALEFIGMNIGLYGPVGLLGLFTFAVSWARRRGGRLDAGRYAGRLFLFLTAAPLILFYFGVTFFTDGEGNWTAAAYTTLAALAGIGAVEGVDEMRARTRLWRTLPEPRPKWGTLRRAPENARQVAWHAALLVGVISGLAMLRLDWFARLPLVGSAVPIGRLTGADRMGADAARRVEALGPGAFIIAQHYGRASQLAFYTTPAHARAGDDHGPVRSSSAYMGGRRTQYDYWMDTSLDRAELVGRDALVIGASAAEWAVAFDTVEPAGTLDSDGKRQRPAFVARGYRGFPGMRIRAAGDGGGP